MIIEIEGTKIYDFEIPSGSSIYKKWDPAEINRVVNELRLSIPQMAEERPHDALFLVWQLWASSPPSHHATLGNIVSEIVKSGLVPLTAMSGKEVGSTKRLYFLNSQEELTRTTHINKEPI
tara:strand:+ start:295 stop:657 length:363 start_codon:yes stop_codon:yes gene_type:complete